MLTDTQAQDLTIIRHHNCQVNHQNPRTFLKCAYPRALWVTGHGAYASMAHFPRGHPHRVRSM